MLSEFIEAHRNELIARARGLASTRPWPEASQEELTRGIPLILGRLATAIRPRDEPATPAGAVRGSGEPPPWSQLRSMGLTVSQVVHDFGEVCRSITLTAEHQGEHISATDSHLLVRCLDDALAEAVTEFARLKDVGVAQVESDRMGLAVHALRNELHTAMLAFDILRTGTTGMSGSTAAVLARSLLSLRDLIDTTLADVRLVIAEPRRDRIKVKAVVEEVAVAAGLLAAHREIRFQVAAVDPALEVEADLPLLAFALSRLLQNAFMDAREGGLVTLRTRGEHGRVFLEVTEPGGDGPEPDGTRPLKASAMAWSAERPGLGPGLSILRKAVTAIGGQVRTPDRPGQAGTFEIELPAAAAAR
jgi:K+-sensing histidine kinase KdpD